MCVIMPIRDVPSKWQVPTMCITLPNMPIINLVQVMQKWLWICVNGVMYYLVPIWLLLI